MNSQICKERVARIGLLFKNTREKQNLTLQDVATRSGLSYPYVSNLEKGRLDNASLLSLLMLAEILNIEKLTISIK